MITSKNITEKRMIEYIHANPWDILVGLIIGTCLTYLWCAYYEYRWPFHKLPRQY